MADRMKHFLEFVVLYEWNKHSNFICWLYIYFTNVKNKACQNIDLFLLNRLPSLMHSITQSVWWFFSDSTSFHLENSALWHATDTGLSRGKWSASSRWIMRVLYATPGSMRNVGGHGLPARCGPVLSALSSVFSVCLVFSTGSQMPSFL